MKHYMLLVLAVFAAMVGIAGLGAADEKAKLGGEGEVSLEKLVPADGWFVIQSGTVAIIRAPNGVRHRVTDCLSVEDCSDDEPYQCFCRYASNPAEGRWIDF